MKCPESVNILLLGSGGREHAFAWKIAQSKRLARLYIAPGNAGTAACGTNVDINPANFAVVKQFVLTNNINMVVVGPEDPLVKGISDFFKEDSQISNIPVIGPSALGAKLEGSKEFAKDFMVRHNIPTARYRSFTRKSLDEAKSFLETLKAPYVLKADGLAAGKGVLIVDSLDQAKQELESMLGGRFGRASDTVVIEEFLSGIECSVFVATDNKNFCVLPVAKDYKRVGVGDTGLNTGGMGAVSPVPFADEAFMQKVVDRIVRPSVDGMKADKIDYKGFLFIGLMNVAGDPYVIEYNVRMGDPETEVVLPRIESDLIELFQSIAYGRLDRYELKVTPKIATTVVCVSGGYPGEYTKGIKINGLRERTDSIVFHAGTSEKGGHVLTAGGRVLAVTSFGDSILEAVGESFKTIDKIDYEGKYFRSDIGRDLL